jgi:hypothetical protein
VTRVSVTEQDVVSEDMAGENVASEDAASEDAANAAAAEPDRPPDRGRPSAGFDLLAAVLSLAGAFWITAGVWVDPNHRVVRVNAGDQALFEWFLAYAAHALTHLHDPLWTDLINVPDGANLAVNTSVTVPGMVLAPVTLLLGPPVAFLVVLTANLALSGYAWYWLFSRKLAVSPAAAVVGGLFCGFAPSVVSHANAHLNFTAQFLVPLILARLLALRVPGHTVRNGLALGVLVAIQYSLGAETLFFTALACAVLLGIWLLAGHREAWTDVLAASRALAVAGGTALVALAYPLWLQFFGRGTYHGTGFDQRIHSEDIAAYAAFPHRSLAGLAGLDTGLAPNPTEENSFFGWPLLVVVAVAVVLLLRKASRTADRSRRAPIWALAGTGVVFAVFSFGPVVKFQTRITDTPLPYSWIAHLPLFDSALPARLALVVTPVIGALLALALHELLRGRPRWRALGMAAVAAALVPLVPLPVPAADRSPVPHFISAGIWRSYVRPGHVLLPVPPTSDLLPDGQRWQAAAMSTSDGATFRIPAGFFLGPGGPDGRGQIGPVPRPTYILLRDVALTGEVRPVTASQRADAASDLRYWRAELVVLPASGGTGNRWGDHHRVLLETMTALLGAGTRVDDVWLWKITWVRLAARGHAEHESRATRQRLPAASSGTRPRPGPDRAAPEPTVAAPRTGCTPWRPATARPCRREPAATGRPSGQSWTTATLGTCWPTQVRFRWSEQGCSTTAPGGTSSGGYMPP